MRRGSAEGLQERSSLLEEGQLPVRKCLLLRVVTTAGCTRKRVVLTIDVFGSHAVRTQFAYSRPLASIER